MDLGSHHYRRIANWGHATVWKCRGYCDFCFCVVSNQDSHRWKNWNITITNVFDNYPTCIYLSFAKKLKRTDDLKLDKYNPIFSVKESRYINSHASEEILQFRILASSQLIRVNNFHGLKKICLSKNMIFLPRPDWPPCAPLPCSRSFPANCYVWIYFRNTNSQEILAYFNNESMQSGDILVPHPKCSFHFAKDLNFGTIITFNLGCQKEALDSAFHR